MDARLHDWKVFVHTFKREEDEYKVTVKPFSIRAGIRLISFLESEKAEKAIPAVVGLILGSGIQSEDMAQSLIALVQDVFPRMGDLSIDLIATVLKIKKNGEALDETEVNEFLLDISITEMFELLTDSLDLMGVDKLAEVFTRLGGLFKKVKKEIAKQQAKPSNNPDHPAKK